MAVVPAHPSATVVLVRDGLAGLEVLMVCRSKQVQHMGGMWVFPGGRVDPEDQAAATGEIEAAINAAIRETREEAGVAISGDELHFLSHWTTPEAASKRFATWFFAGVMPAGEDVTVDGGEIAQHRWVRPAAAIAELRAGELRLMPPTYVTLLELLPHASSATLLDAMAQHEPWIYAPCITEIDGAMHFLYQGDAGYATADPACAGPRHRCIMAAGQLDYIREI